MNINNLYDQTVHILKLPYKGNDGVNLIKSNQNFNLEDIMG